MADLAENEFLGDLAISKIGNSIWIWYDDIAAEGIFVWKDGSVSEFVNWTATKTQIIRKAKTVWI